MHTISRFWHDESGSVVSAEMVLIGGLVATGAVAGLETVSNAVDDEVRDVTRAIRNVDQSYSYRGFRGCNSMTAGSAFGVNSIDSKGGPTGKSPGKGSGRSTEKSPGASQRCPDPQSTHATPEAAEPAAGPIGFDSEYEEEESLEFEADEPAASVDENYTPRGQMESFSLREMSDHG